MAKQFQWMTLLRVKEVCSSSVPRSTLLFPIQVELGGVETLTSTSKKVCSLQPSQSLLTTTSPHPEWEAVLGQNSTC